MKAPSRDMMNTLARSVLTLFSYDDNASDISLPNVLRQCIQLIALFPVLSVYAYQAYNHYERGESLFIHLPDPELSTAENILHLLRPDSKYTKLEAKLLDMALVLHAEHGGGNNSTFTTHVVSSSGTDTYSAIAAALCSLKGPKHGGANIKVVQMFDDLKANVKDWSNEEEIREYLLKLLNKEAFDKAGLIYGMGHAVYSLSDPRSKILSRFVKQLSEEKGKEEVKKSENDPIISEAIIILTNENTASASEILAGALKDLGKATIVGTKTYGKGVIQQILTVKDGSGIKLTVEEYQTPNRNKINKIGIEPNETVELPSDVESVLNVPEDKDTQLQKAQEIANKNQ